MKQMKVGPQLVVTVFDPDGDRWAFGIVKGSLRDKDDNDIYVEGMVDAIESIVLSHACAGITVDHPAYVEGIQTAIDACSNNA